MDLLGPDGKSAGKKAMARGFGVLPGDPAELELTMKVLCALHRAREHGKLSGSLAKELDASIDDGFAWLQLHFKGFDRFPLLVLARRLGVIFGRDHVGTVPWKEEGLKFLGFQGGTRGYVGPDCSRRIACTLYFLAKRFLG